MYPFDDDAVMVNLQYSSALRIDLCCISRINILCMNHLTIYFRRHHFLLGTLILIFILLLYGRTIIKGYFLFQSIKNAFLWQLYLLYYLYFIKSIFPGLNEWFFCFSERFLYRNSRMKSMTIFENPERSYVRFSNSGMKFAILGRFLPIFGHFSCFLSFLGY